MKLKELISEKVVVDSKIQSEIDELGTLTDKIEILNSITAKLRDYIGDVDTSEGLVNSFHSDKKTIIISCSMNDYTKIVSDKKSEDLIIIKANPLFEIEHKK